MSDPLVEGALGRVKASIDSPVSLMGGEAATLKTADLRTLVAEVERLREASRHILAHERNASRSDLDDRYDAEAQQRRAEKAEAYVARLEHHLEIDRLYEMKDGEKVEVPIPPDQRESMIASGFDGIDCRNETIKLQDLRIAALKARLAQTETMDEKTR